MLRYSAEKLNIWESDIQLILNFENHWYLKNKKAGRGVIRKKGNLIKSLRMKNMDDKCEFLFMSSTANSDFSS